MDKKSLVKTNLTKDLSIIAKVICDTHWGMVGRWRTQSDEGEQILRGKGFLVNWLARFLATNFGYVRWAQKVQEPD